MLNNSFIYGTSAALRHCPVCSANLFYYSAHRLTWMYCTLCRVFFTPNRERDISRFLVTVAQALEATKCR
jgi:hypothetical protein